MQQRLQTPRGASSRSDSPFRSSGEGFFLPAARYPMNDKLQKLRDAVVGRDREVEVTPTGEVREVGKPDSPAVAPEAGKATKLADRTFGVR